MSFDTLLQHTVTIERTTFDADALDEYRQPVSSTSTVDVAAMVQPRIRGAREVLDSRSAGVPIADHRVFLRETEVTPKDSILWEGKRFEILGIEHHAYGSVPHLELDVRLIGEPATT